MNTLRWLFLSTFALTTILAGAISVAAAGRPAQGPPPQLEQVARWGCDACDGPELFGAVNDVAVTSTGTVFAVDSYEPVVRRFGANGDAAAFARRGQGPGEIISGTEIAIVGDNALEVIDSRQRRMMRLDFEGNELGTRPLPSYPTVLAYSIAHHSWYLNLIDFKTFTSTVVRLPDGGNETYVLRAADWPLGDDQEPTEFYPMAVGEDGGFAVGDGNHEYRVRLFDAAGNAVAEIHRDIDRQEKTPEEIEVEEDRREASAARRAAMLRAEGATGPGRGPRPIDPVKRFFYTNALQYDDQGRLWVLTGRGTHDASVFDVFGTDNAYLGEVAIDAHASDFDIAGEWLVTSGMGDLDHPVVMLWRIR